MKRMLRMLTPLAILTVLPVAAAERTLHLDPQSTEVAFLLKATGHDVSGAFELTEGVIVFDGETGTASGALRVDSRNAETGNKKRDKAMHEKVLESETFPDFVFQPRRVEGALPQSGSAEVTLHGTMSIHGSEHPLVIPARIDVDGSRVAIHATFDIPFVEWGMKDPSFLFLRVAKQVGVTVDAVGTLSEGDTASSRPDKH